MNAEELLANNGIKLDSTAPGRYYTTCPKCSATRSRAHQGSKVLGVTIGDDGSVHFGCSHCSWTGPEKGSGKGRNGRGGEGFAATYDYTDAAGALLFQKVRNAPGGKPGFSTMLPTSHAPSPKDESWPWSRAKRMPTACARSASSQPATRMARAN
jgi:hypothetical protein